MPIVDRRHDFVRLGQDILTQMSEPVLEDLKAQIASRRVVLVVGSGVSIASTGNAGAASWTGLLRLGVERCVSLDPSLAGDWQDRALADVTSKRIDDLLAGASKIARTLRRHSEWSRWLEDTVGSLKATQTGLIDAIGRLDAPILTTNYDDLLERRLGHFPITWRDKADQIAFARLEARDTVLHLHGHWRQPDSVILDLGDYERVVGDPLAQAGLRTMGEAWSLLFVGCGDGLADPNFEQFLEWMSSILVGARHRHFRLERSMDVSQRQEWHNVRGHRVRVLSYGESHDDLQSFVASLPRAAPTPTVSTDVSPSRHSAARPALSAGEYIRLQEKGRTAVRQLIVLAHQLGWDSIAAHGRELSDALEEDLYRVAITGRSRSGKSTLLNALVRRAICPVERVITTAIPIVVGPGETETATVAFEPAGRPPLHFDGPITADMLAPYAAQQHNANNLKRVDHIEVHLGNQVLDLGVEYVDIPGFDDPDGRIWAATNQVIERAHALVLVLDVSTYESGGFAFDKATRDLLDLSQRRARPVLVVCNKADKLSPSDRKGADSHLRDELGRFGLLGSVPRPMFFLSARDATEARGRGEEERPTQFAAFEDALWDQLWNTDSVGLRRLHRVFEALRVADEEVTALVRVRYAKGPERDILRTSIARCREDGERIRGTCIHDTKNLRVLATQAIERALGDMLRQVSQQVLSLRANHTIPPLSATIEALQPHLDARCRATLNELAPEVTSRHERVESAVARSLTDLRERIGLSAHAQETRKNVEAISLWATAIAVPGSSSGARTMRVVAAGGGTAAAIGAAVGGPLGWFLGLGFGLVVSAVVDHVTDRMDSWETLSDRLEQHVKTAIASFGRRVDDALISRGNLLDQRVQERMGPFLSDLEARLETIREPTADELRLHAEMGRTTADVLALLAGILGNRSPAPK